VGPIRDEVRSYNNPRAQPEELAEEMVRMLVRSGATFRAAADAPTSGR
jgi:hypothetical protein